MRPKHTLLKVMLAGLLVGFVLVVAMMAEIDIERYGWEPVVLGFLMPWIIFAVAAIMVSLWRRA